MNSFKHGAYQLMQNNQVISMRLEHLGFHEVERIKHVTKEWNYAHFSKKSLDQKDQVVFIA